MRGVALRIGLNGRDARCRVVHGLSDGRVRARQWRPLLARPHWGGGGGACPVKRPLLRVQAGVCTRGGTCRFTHDGGGGV
jgi:hypothetical protein